MSPRRRDAAASRDSIVEAAMAAFAERGYTGVTVRDIAAGADVDPALVIRYFGSKSALFALTLGAGGPLLAAVLDEPLDTVPDRVARFLAAKRADPGAPEGHAALSALVLSAADVEGRQLLADLIAEHLERPLVQRLVAAGVSADESAVRARAVTAVILGHSLAVSALAPPQLDEAGLTALLRAALGPL